MGKLAEIYGSSNCGYCAQALRWCELEKNVNVVFYDIEKAINHATLERRINKEVKFSPHIFIDGDHLEGGFLELRSFLKYG